jgi:hypothetical protein
VVVVADEDEEQVNTRGELRTHNSRLEVLEETQSPGAVGPAEEDWAAISRTAAPLIKMQLRHPVCDLLQDWL